VVRRLQLTLLALVAVPVTVVAVVPAVLVLVAVPLTVIWVGIPLLLGTLWLLRTLLGPFRTWAGWVRERTIIPPYHRSDGGGWLSRLRWALTDGATWRDELWVLVALSAGSVLLLMAVGLALAVPFLLIYPFLMWVTPPGVFETPFAFLPVASWKQGFTMWPLAAIALALWWAWTPGLLRGWAGICAGLLGPTRASLLAGRVSALTAIRAETVDSAAAEIRRIERDLHDGVQVRLVSLGMSIGMAENLVDSDPARARVLLAEAALATSSTLTELRRLVRGFHPPVLADRGLIGAVRALALDMPIPTTVAVEGFPAGHERLPEPIEACSYFAVAEALANAVKHADPSAIAVSLQLVDVDAPGQRVVIGVADDGRGGARLGGGSGLDGLTRRLAALDGTLAVLSPPGGPTRLTMEVPCAPSSPKITPSSARV
jgi:signal transduction histidine kinase